jgi:hypothetical protein
VSGTRSLARGHLVGVWPRLGISKEGRLSPRPSELALDGLALDGLALEGDRPGTLGHPRVSRRGLRPRSEVRTSMIDRVCRATTPGYWSRGRRGPAGCGSKISRAWGGATAAPNGRRVGLTAGGWPTGTRWSTDNRVPLSCRSLRHPRRPGGRPAVAGVLRKPLLPAQIAPRSNYLRNKTTGRAAQALVARSVLVAGAFFRRWSRPNPQRGPRRRRRVRGGSRCRRACPSR